jgi:hypothetical protein
LNSQRIRIYNPIFFENQRSFLEIYDKIVASIRFPLASSNLKNWNLYFLFNKNSVAGRENFFLVLERINLLSMEPRKTADYNQKIFQHKYYNSKVSKVVFIIWYLEHVTMRKWNVWILVWVFGFTLKIKWESMHLIPFWSRIIC